MNLPEFKAWFEGFTENLDGAPNEKAWKRIKEKIGKIQDAPSTPRTVFIEHWAHPWRRHFDYPYWHGSIGYAQQSVGNNGYAGSPAMQMASANAASQGVQRAIGLSADSVTSDDFDSGSAFRDLGRAEAKSMRR